MEIIKLIEVADTWQGEGPNSGRQMLIARFKYCNKACAYCDTIIRMKTMAEGSYTIEDLNEALEKTHGLMISGGEPTFGKNFDQTILMLKECNYDIVNIETNGYQLDRLIDAVSNLLPELKNKINIMYSPKIFIENDYATELDKIDLAVSTPNVYIKIVADPSNKLNEMYIRELAKKNKDSGKIYLMPLGVTPAEIQSNFDYCVNLADELHLNMSSRLHIMHSFV